MRRNEFAGCGAPQVFSSGFQVLRKLKDFTEQDVPAPSGFTFPVNIYFITEQRAEFIKH